MNHAFQQMRVPANPKPASANLRLAIANIGRLQRLAHHRSSKWIDALALRQLRDCGMQRN
jgi:hypothetical protein